MARHTLYIYVDGSDLDEVAAPMEQEVNLYVQSITWPRPTWVVNQKHPPDPSIGPGDLPDWDLGVNHEFPDPGKETPGWFKVVEQLVEFFGGLSEAFDRRFVVGIADSQTGVTEDLHSISGKEVDLPRLRLIVGIEPPNGNR